MKVDIRKPASITRYKMAKDYEQAVDTNGNSGSLNYTGKKGTTQDYNEMPIPTCLANSKKLVRLG